MKLFLALLPIFACITVANAAVSQCYACVAETFADCDANQFMIDCSNETFPNIGSYHCYTATGWYIENNDWKTRVARGCANCTSGMVNKETLKTAFESNTGWNFTDYFASSCCNTNNCNNRTTVDTPPTTTATMVMSSTTGPSMSSPPSAQPTTKSHASHLLPFSGILTFAVIVVGAILF